MNMAAEVTAYTGPAEAELGANLSGMRTRARRAIAGKLPIIGDALTGIAVYR
jgi:hypothetical protein